MTDPNWAIPGAQAYLHAPTAAAVASRQRTAAGSNPDEYVTEPEGWPCSVWMFISDRMEET